MTTAAVDLPLSGPPLVHEIKYPSMYRAWCGKLFRPKDIHNAPQPVTCVWCAVRRDKW